MSKINKIPELLAPAGSLDTLKASVNAGADAVYLSGKRFGARQFAQNFNKTEMEEAIEYAHIRGVKVYVTVNTLVRENELLYVGEHLTQLYSMGADAVIVQDLGIARLARNIIPEMDLHCSTQMTIHNTDGIKWALENGFKRVVLAREMNLKDITAAAKQTHGKIELEVFAHGAICYCYSGQCLLSSFIGGRSGNRGMCAQPCRKNYDLIIGKKDRYGKIADIENVHLKSHYLLSTKDLAIYSQLDKIAKSPINSIKIEGRMRPSEYVANVVKVYRHALDLLEKNQWKSSQKEISELEACFNRGLTRGWIMGTAKEQVMGRDNPGNRGLYIGRVVNQRNDETIITLKSDINPKKGDGILFKDPEKTGSESNIWGTVLEFTPQVNKGKLSLKLRKPVKKGSTVFITRKKSLVDDADRIVKNPQLPLPIPLKVQISWDDKLTPIIHVNISHPVLGDFEMEYEADFSMEKAKKKPLSYDTIIKQLKKTGGTPFIIKNIQMDYPGNLFTPIRNLNHLRREILKKVENTITEHKKPSLKEVKSAETNLSSWKTDYYNVKKSKNTGLNSCGTAEQFPVVGVYVDSVSSLEAALDSECKLIYFQPAIRSIQNKDYESFDNIKSKSHNNEEYKSSNKGKYKSPTNFNCLNDLKDYNEYFGKVNELLNEASILCKRKEADLIWVWPAVTNNYYINGATELAKKAIGESISGVEVGGVGALWALKKYLDFKRLYGSSNLNIWNRMSINELSNELNTVNLSTELSKVELEKLIKFSRSNDCTTNFGLLVQGNLDVLVSEDCLPCIVRDKKLIRSINNPESELGIKDSKNRVFPIVLDDACRTHILNSVELCLIDHLPSLIDMGINRFIIDARTKPEDYVRIMVPTYSEALKICTNNAPHLKSKLNSLKKRVKKISHGGITTVNFLRGIKEDN